MKLGPDWPGAVLTRTGARAMFVAALLIGFSSPSLSWADICAEPNDAPGAACELRPNRKAAGELDAVDADRYRIKVDDGQSIAVTFSASKGSHKLRVESPDGVPLAEAGQAPGARRVVADRLPAGVYVAYVAGDESELLGERSYEISWTSEGMGDPVPVLAPNGRPLRDLVLSTVDVGEKAIQTRAHLSVGGRGREYLAVFERENTQPVWRHGPMYIMNRVFVGESHEAAMAQYATWSLDHLPEADAIGRPYTSLGGQPMPGVGDESHALGACFKCDDENPMRHYRLVVRAGSVVWLLFTWGRDSSANFDVIMSLVGKLTSKL